MAFANNKPVNHVTWPFGAGTGNNRMVVGADTPDELISYGVQVAMLFYVVDVPTGLEVGYFFIGLSNILDFNATNNTCLFGEVVYPTPGVPSSATMASVKTHFQMTMDDPGVDLASTRFKDFVVLVNDTVPEWQNSSPLTTFRDEFWMQGYTRVRANSPVNPVNSGVVRFESGARLQLDQNAAFQWDQNSLEPGRGLCTQILVPSAGPNIGTTETVDLVSPSYTFQAHRAYRVTVQSGLTASAAGLVAFRRLMKGSTVVTGNSLGEFGRTYIGSSATSGGWFYGAKEFVCGSADKTTTLCVSLQAGTGTASPGTVSAYANSSSPRTMTIEDIGWDYQVASGLPVLT